MRSTAAELERRLAAEFPEAFHADSGLAILEAVRGRARVRLVPQHKATRPGGTISGPTLMMLADVDDVCRAACLDRLGAAGGHHQPQHQFSQEAGARRR